VNYAIGRWIGPKIFHYESSRFFNRDHLMKAHAFYEKYGGRAIILARFVPIVRTFAPFVAGSGAMDYRKFMTYNIVGALLWIGSLVPAGWYFGNFPIVKDNFEIVVFGIIGVSLLPMVIEFARAKLSRKPSSDATQD
jgi:membrane-associated protein